MTGAILQLEWIIGRTMDNRVGCNLELMDVLVMVSGIRSGLNQNIEILRREVNYE